MVLTGHIEHKTKICHWGGLSEHALFMPVLVSVGEFGALHLSKVVLYPAWPHASGVFLGPDKLCCKLLEMSMLSAVLNLVCQGCSFAVAFLCKMLS